MAYILQLKLGKLRRELGLNYIEPVSIEPALEMSPTRPWSMTQRILTEIQIIRFYLGVPGQPPATVAVKDKRAVDAFNKLNQASAETELLAGAVTPNEVYSQAKRLHEDVNAVLRQQGIFEHAVPPPRRENFQPKDSLRAVFDVMSEIQRLQRARGMSTTDFKGFDSTNKTVPDDVFDAVGLTLAELQRLKARLGMVHQLTPPATYEKNKTPSDVVQLLGYTSAKLREIK